MNTVVEVYNHQDAVALSDRTLMNFEDLANQILPQAMSNPANGGGVLMDLETVEISIVDDAKIAQVHADFMDIPGATDVITFAHGEIVISSETARAQAKDFGHSTEREIVLYIVHGLLHLSGHEDAEEGERKAMEEIQFQILESVFPKQKANAS